MPCDGRSSSGASPSADTGMTLEWPDSRCIICLSPNCTLTKAHVIPSAIGGHLVVRCMCRDCNSRLGSTVEANLKADPCIRLAIEGIGRNVPRVDAMRDGQLFLSQADGLRIKAMRERGAYRILDSPQERGSRVKSPERAHAEIATTLRRRGASAEEIDKALALHDEAPVDQLTELAPGLAIKKGSMTNFAPVLGTPLVDEACLLSIGYLFLAMLLGREIYDAALQPIRDALRGTPSSRPWRVEPLAASRAYEPWHGLTFDTSEPHITVHIRLFGQLVWLVHFTEIQSRAASLAPIYTLDLATGREHWRLVTP